jgi:predicted nucleotidyltransferase
MHPLIESHRMQLRALASRYGISSIQVFGSMARDDANNLSDVDFLVEGSGPLSGFSLGAMLMDAQDLLGRKIDIVTVNSLHPLMRDRVLRESLPI